MYVNMNYRTKKDFKADVEKFHATLTHIAIEKNVRLIPHMIDGSLFFTIAGNAGEPRPYGSFVRTHGLPDNIAIQECLGLAYRFKQQPNLLGRITENGHETVEGPHSPQPHKWYAEVEIRNGVIVNVK